jgi:hypothetical protein
VTAAPGPVERCGYTITPEPGRYATFNPLTHNVRISKDGAHATFPARLWSSLADVDDDIVQGILASLFYMPDDWEPPKPEPLTATKTVAYITMSQELYDEGMAFAAAQDAYFAMSPEQRAEHGRAAEAERAVRLAAQLAAAEQLVADAKLAAINDAQCGGSAFVDAVLGVHRPQVRELAHTVTCSGCWDGGEYDDNVEWPCPTIEAIKGAIS